MFENILARSLSMCNRGIISPVLHQFIFQQQDFLNGTGFEGYGLLQAAEKLIDSGKKCQGTTSVVPIRSGE
jgi:hypothetical protein